MKISKLVFKNFSSFGNKVSELIVPETPSLVLLHGKNGHGKSSISNAIKFAIFGKLESKKLKDISNRLNKNCETKIYLETSKNKIEIERGLEPNFFKVSLNGNEIDKAGKKSVQEYLEEEILEIPFYVFTNTMSLSINDFKSFLRMSAADKRAIIDKIFGLQIINDMRENVKEKLKNLKDESVLINVEINSLKQSKESAVNELELLMQKIEETNEDEKEQLETKMSETKLFLIKLNEKSEAINTKLKELNLRKIEVEKVFRTKRELKFALEEKVKLLKNSKCPYCESDLETHDHKESLKEKEIEVENLEIEIKKIEELLEKIKKKSGEYNQNILNIKLAERKTKSQQEFLKEKLKSLEIDNNEEASSIEKMISRFDEQVNEKLEKISKNQKIISYYSFVDEAMGEKGMKKLAIKSILPPFNNEISKLSKIMSLEHKIIFDENFNARITHFGVEVSADTLSTGELKKVDFAVLLAVIKLLKIKFPTINMLFLDEIFNGLDSDSQHHILVILKNIVRDYKLNIFVVNHFLLSLSDFDYELEVKKNGGFSSFVMKKVD